MSKPTEPQLNVVSPPAFTSDIPADLDQDKTQLPLCHPSRLTRFQQPRRLQDIADAIAYLEHPDRYAAPDWLVGRTEQSRAQARQCVNVEYRHADTDEWISPDHVQQRQTEQQPIIKWLSILTQPDENMGMTTHPERTERIRLMPQEWSLRYLMNTDADPRMNGGARRMWKHIQRQFWGMPARAVQRFVRNSTSHQVSRNMVHYVQEHWNIYSRPFERAQIDLIGPLDAQTLTETRAKVKQVRVNELKRYRRRKREQAEDEKKEPEMKQGGARVRKPSRRLRQQMDAERADRAVAARTVRRDNKDDKQPANAEDILYQDDDKNPSTVISYDHALDRDAVVLDTVKGVYVMTYIDCFSHYANAVVLRNKEADTVAQGLIEMMDTIQQDLGMAESPFTKLQTLQTDNGSEFISDAFQALLKKYNIRHIRSRAYSPRSQGAIERFNRYLKTAMFYYRTRHQTVSDSAEKALEAMLAAIPGIIQNHNLSVHSASNFTPMEIMQWNARDPQTAIKYMQIRTRMQRHVAKAQQKLAARQHTFDSTRLSCLEWQLGDLVRLNNPLQMQEEYASSVVWKITGITDQAPSSENHFEAVCTPKKGESRVVRWFGLVPYQTKEVGQETRLRSKEYAQQKKHPDMEQKLTKPDHDETKVKWFPSCQLRLVNWLQPGDVVRILKPQLDMTQKKLDAKGFRKRVGPNWTTELYQVTQVLHPDDPLLPRNAIRYMVKPLVPYTAHAASWIETERHALNPSESVQRRTFLRTQLQRVNVQSLLVDVPLVFALPKPGEIVLIQFPVVLHDKSQSWRECPGIVLDPGIRMGAPFVRCWFQPWITTIHATLGDLRTDEQRLTKKKKSKKPRPVVAKEQKKRLAKDQRHIRQSDQWAYGRRVPFARIRTVFTADDAKEATPLEQVRREWLNTGAIDPFKHPQHTLLLQQYQLNATDTTVAPTQAASRPLLDPLKHVWLDLTPFKDISSMMGWNAWMTRTLFQVWILKTCTVEGPLNGCIWIVPVRPAWTHYMQTHSHFSELKKQEEERKNAEEKQQLPLVTDQPAWLTTSWFTFLQHIEQAEQGPQLRMYERFRKFGIWCVPSRALIPAVVHGQHKLATATTPAAAHALTSEWAHFLAKNLSLEQDDDPDQRNDAVPELPNDNIELLRKSVQMMRTRRQEWQQLGLPHAVKIPRR